MRTHPATAAHAVSSFMNSDTDSSQIRRFSDSLPTGVHFDLRSRFEAIREQPPGVQTACQEDGLTDRRQGIATPCDEMVGLREY